MPPIRGEPGQAAAAVVMPQRATVVILLANPELQGETGLDCHGIGQEDIGLVEETDSHNGERFRGVQPFRGGHVGLVDGFASGVGEKLLKGSQSCHRLKW